MLEIYSLNLAKFIQQNINAKNSWSDSKEERYKNMLNLPQGYNFFGTLKKVLNSTYFVHRVCGKLSSS